MFFCIMVVLETGGMLSVSVWKNHQEASQAEAESMQLSVHPTAISVERTPKAADEAALQQQVTRILGADANRFSIYFLRPDREEEPFLYQPRQMSPASMIKVFIMATAMQEVKDGRLSLDEKLTIAEDDVVGGAGVITWYNIGEQMTLRRLLTVMITDSDNSATNIIIDRLGMDQINHYITAHGYKDTELAHKMMIGNNGWKNYSSARDIGHLLTRLYYHELVGEQEDKFMLGILSRQKDTECFPAALPDWSIAHKTGEVTGLYDDGGIFYGADGDFILVIMDEAYTDRQATIESMKELTRYFARTMKKKA
ncbi:MAG: class A beta-lactamase-related serine hydrolase [Selenomonas sp.]|nr:class A beta-lactamase-related serine hydrolase [Selenomonas sp.]